MPIYVSKTTPVMKAAVIDPEETKDDHGVKQNQRVVTFLIPCATPGSGKSFCMTAIKEHISKQSDWSF